MAQYQHLPIYKQTYDILLRTMTATKEFPREYKYTLGQKIKDELIELVVMIYRANSAADKERHIESDRRAGSGDPAYAAPVPRHENIIAPPLRGAFRNDGQSCETGAGLAQEFGKGEDRTGSGRQK